MPSEVPAPKIPAYQPPVDRKPATLPLSMQANKPHGILNKVVGKILKAPKVKGMFKMMSMKKNPKAITKPKKKKIV